MFLSEQDMAFDNALRTANTCGCAYGYLNLGGSTVPILTLLGTTPDGFKKAFEVFKRWGCEVDGDAVSITVAFRKAGGYFLVIGPSTDRFLQRMSPDFLLQDSLSFGLFWIKQFDTTNPALLEFSQYSKGAFAPIAFGAGTVSVSNGVPVGGPSGVRTIEGLPDILTYKMRFVHEDEEPDYFVFRPKDKKVRAPQVRPNKDLPKDISKFRRRAIDQAFPVTRARVRRAGLFEAIKADSEFASVTTDQVTQAAINILLSEELTTGRLHFEGVNSVAEKAWDCIFKRYERADGKDPVPALSLSDLKAQVCLDVSALLKSEGVNSGTHFSSRQAEFLRRGYA